MFSYNISFIGKQSKFFVASQWRTIANIYLSTPPSYPRYRFLLNLNARGVGVLFKREGFALGRHFGFPKSVKLE